MAGVRWSPVKLGRHFALGSTGEFFPWDYFCSLSSLSGWMMEKTSCAVDTKLGWSYNEFGGHNQKRSVLGELEN